jgi:hypothetical protein
MLPANKPLSPWTVGRSDFWRIGHQTLIVQATTLPYIDTFIVLATAAAIMFVLSFRLRKNHPGGGRVVME